MRAATKENDGTLGRFDHRNSARDVFPSGTRRHRRLEAGEIGECDLFIKGGFLQSGIKTNIGRAAGLGAHHNIGAQHGIDNSFG